MRQVLDVPEQAILEAGFGFGLDSDQCRRFSGNPRFGFKGKPGNQSKTLFGPTIEVLLDHRKIKEADRNSDGRIPKCTLKTGLWANFRQNFQQLGDQDAARAQTNKMLGRDKATSHANSLTQTATWPTNKVYHSGDTLEFWAWEKAVVGVAAGLIKAKHVCVASVRNVAEASWCIAFYTCDMQPARPKQEVQAAGSTTTVSTCSVGFFRSLRLTRDLSRTCATRRVFLPKRSIPQKGDTPN